VLLSSREDGLPPPFTNDAPLPCAATEQQPKPRPRLANGAGASGGGRGGTHSPARATAGRGGSGSGDHHPTADDADERDATGGGGHAAAGGTARRSARRSLGDGEMSERFALDVPPCLWYHPNTKQPKKSHNVSG
jgi:hypothetical protein